MSSNPRVPSSRIKHEKQPVAFPVPLRAALLERPRFGVTDSLARVLRSGLSSKPGLHMSVPCSCTHGARFHGMKPRTFSRGHDMQAVVPVPFKFLFAYLHFVPGVIFLYSSKPTARKALKNGRRHAS